MESYKEYFTEAKIESDEDLIKSIESNFKKHFPNGWIITGINKGLGGYLGINMGIIGNRSELPSKILDNDPVHHKFIIHKEKGGYSAEVLVGGISINPPKDSYLAMGNVKTKWRKTKGDTTKINKAFDTFFKRLKALVKEHESDIYHRDMYSNKYFK
jgi:hypothetical protein